MYEIKRRPIIKEELKLGDEVLKIEIAPDAIIREYKAASAALIRAQDAANGPDGKKPEAIEAYGEAIIEFLGVVLGKENAEKLLNFFENNYAEMLIQIMPFVLEVIKPQIDESVASVQAAAREVYKKGKYGKKWRR